jgi:hypothetical protein
MIKLENILLEAISLDKIDVLIKTSTDINKVEVYNQLRAIDGVVVITVEQNEFLVVSSDKVVKDAHWSEDGNYIFVIMNDNEVKQNKAK